MKYSAEQGVNKLTETRGDRELHRLIRDYETSTADALRQAEQAQNAREKEYFLRLAKVWAELATTLKACR